MKKSNQDKKARGAVPNKNKGFSSTGLSSGQQSGSSSVSTSRRFPEKKQIKQVEYRNGSYLGTVLQNEDRSILGLYAWDSGEVYFGEWKHDMLDGEGILFFPEGGFIHGFFQHNKINGAAFFKFENGDIYEGFWRNGKLEGNCYKYFTDQDRWILSDYKAGEFKRVIQKGDGLPPSCKFSISIDSLDQIIFVLDVFNYITSASEMVAKHDENPCSDQLKIEAITFQDGGQFLGLIKDEMPVGLGIFRYGDGKYDVGNYQKGNLHGLGRLNLHNGDFYDGYLVDGLFQGKGVFFQRSSCSWIFGEFEENKCINIIRKGQGSIPFELIQKLRQEHHSRGQFQVDKETPLEVYNQPIYNSKPVNPDVHNFYLDLSVASVQSLSQSNQKKQDTFNQVLPKDITDSSPISPSRTQKTSGRIFESISKGTESGSNRNESGSNRNESSIKKEDQLIEKGTPKEEEASEEKISQSIGIESGQKITQPNLKSLYKQKLSYSPQQNFLKLSLSPKEGKQSKRAQSLKVKDGNQMSRQKIIATANAIMSKTGITSSIKREPRSQKIQNSSPKESEQPKRSKAISPPLPQETKQIKTHGGKGEKNKQTPQSSVSKIQKDNILEDSDPLSMHEYDNATEIKEAQIKQPSPPSQQGKPICFQEDKGNLNQSQESEQNNLSQDKKGSKTKNKKYLSNQAILGGQKEKTFKQQRAKSSNSKKSIQQADKVHNQSTPKTTNRVIKRPKSLPQKSQEQKVKGQKSYHTDSQQEEEQEDSDQSQKDNSVSRDSIQGMSQDHEQKDQNFSMISQNTDKKEISQIDLKSKSSEVRSKKELEVEEIQTIKNEIANFEQLATSSIPERRKKSKGRSPRNDSSASRTPKGNQRDQNPLQIGTSNTSNNNNIGQNLLSPIFQQSPIPAQREEDNNNLDEKEEQHLRLDESEHVLDSIKQIKQQMLTSLHILEKEAHNTETPISNPQKIPEFKVPTEDGEDQTLKDLSLEEDISPQYPVEQQIDNSFKGAQGKFHFPNKNQRYLTEEEANEIAERIERNLSVEMSSFSPKIKLQNLNSNEERKEVEQEEEDLQKEQEEENQEIEEYEEKKSREENEKQELEQQLRSQEQEEDNDSQEYQEQQEDEQQEDDNDSQEYKKQEQEEDDSQENQVVQKSLDQETEEQEMNHEQNMVNQNTKQKSGETEEQVQITRKEDEKQKKQKQQPQKEKHQTSKEENQMHSNEKEEAEVSQSNKNLEKQQKIIPPKTDDEKMLDNVKGEQEQERKEQQLKEGKVSNLSLEEQNQGEAKEEQNINQNKLIGSQGDKQEIKPQKQEVKVLVQQEEKDTQKIEQKQQKADKPLVEEDEEDEEEGEQHQSEQHEDDEQEQEVEVEVEEQHQVQQQEQNKTQEQEDHDDDKDKEIYMEQNENIEEEKEHDIKGERKELEQEHGQSKQNQKLLKSEQQHHLHHEEEQNQSSEQLNTKQEKQLSQEIKRDSKQEKIQAAIDENNLKQNQQEKKVQEEQVRKQTDKIESKARQIEEDVIDQTQQIPQEIEESIKGNENNESIIKEKEQSLRGNQIEQSDQQTNISQAKPQATSTQENQVILDSSSQSNESKHEDNKKQVMKQEEKEEEQNEKSDSQKQKNKPQKQEGEKINQAQLKESSDTSLQKQEAQSNDQNVKSSEDNPSLSNQNKQDQLPQKNRSKANSSQPIEISISEQAQANDKKQIKEEEDARAKLKINQVQKNEVNNNQANVPKYNSVKAETLQQQITQSLESYQEQYQLSNEKNLKQIGVQQQLLENKDQKRAKTPESPHQNIQNSSNNNQQANLTFQQQQQVRNVNEAQEDKTPSKERERNEQEDKLNREFAKLQNIYKEEKNKLEEVEKEVNILTKVEKETKHKIEIEEEKLKGLIYQQEDMRKEMKKEQELREKQEEQKKEKLKQLENQEEKLKDKIKSGEARLQQIKDEMSLIENQREKTKKEIRDITEQIAQKQVSMNKVTMELEEQILNSKKFQQREGEQAAQKKQRAQEAIESEKLKELSEKLKKEQENSLNLLQQLEKQKELQDQLLEQKNTEILNIKRNQFNIIYDSPAQESKADLQFVSPQQQSQKLSYLFEQQQQEKVSTFSPQTNLAEEVKLKQTPISANLNDNNQFSLLLNELQQISIEDQYSIKIQTTPSLEKPKQYQLIEKSGEAITHQDSMGMRRSDIKEDQVSYPSFQQKDQNRSHLEFVNYSLPTECNQNQFISTQSAQNFSFQLLQPVSQQQKVESESASTSQTYQLPSYQFQQISYSNLPKQSNIQKYENDQVQDAEPQNQKQQDLISIVNFTPNKEDQTQARENRQNHQNLQYHEPKITVDIGQQSIELPINNWIQQNIERYSPLNILPQESYQSDQHQKGEQEYIKIEQYQDKNVNGVEQNQVKEGSQFHQEIESLYQVQNTNIYQPEYLQQQDKIDVSVQLKQSISPQPQIDSKIDRQIQINTFYPEHFGNNSEIQQPSKKTEFTLEQQNILNKYFQDHSLNIPQQTEPKIASERSEYISFISSPTFKRQEDLSGTQSIQDQLNIQKSDEKQPLQEFNYQNLNQYISTGQQQSNILQIPNDQFTQQSPSVQELYPSILDQNDFSQGVKLESSNGKQEGLLISSPQNHQQIKNPFQNRESLSLQYLSNEFKSEIQDTSNNIPMTFNEFPQHLVKEEASHLFSYQPQQVSKVDLLIQENQNMQSKQENYFTKPTNQYSPSLNETYTQEYALSYQNPVVSNTLLGGLSDIQQKNEFTSHQSIKTVDLPSFNQVLQDFALKQNNTYFNEAKDTTNHINENAIDSQSEYICQQPRRQAEQKSNILETNLNEKMEDSLNNDQNEQFSDSINPNEQIYSQESSNQIVVPSYKEFSQIQIYQVLEKNSSSSPYNKNNEQMLQHHQNSSQLQEPLQQTLEITNKTLSNSQTFCISPIHQEEATKNLKQKMNTVNLFEGDQNGYNQSASIKPVQLPPSIQKEYYFNQDKQNDMFNQNNTEFICTQSVLEQVKQPTILVIPPKQIEIQINNFNEKYDAYLNYVSPSQYEVQSNELVSQQNQITLHKEVAPLEQEDKTHTTNQQKSFFENKYDQILSTHQEVPQSVVEPSREKISYEPNNFVSEKFSSLIHESHPFLDQLKYTIPSTQIVPYFKSEMQEIEDINPQQQNNLEIICSQPANKQIEQSTPKVKNQQNSEVFQNNIKSQQILSGPAHIQNYLFAIEPSNQQQIQSTQADIFNNVSLYPSFSYNNYEEEQPQLLLNDISQASEPLQTEKIESNYQYSQIASQFISYDKNIVQSDPSPQQLTNNSQIESVCSQNEQKSVIQPNFTYIPQIQYEYASSRQIDLQQKQEKSPIIFQKEEQCQQPLESIIQYVAQPQQEDQNQSEESDIQGLINPNQQIPEREEQNKQTQQPVIYNTYSSNMKPALQNISLPQGLPQNTFHPKQQDYLQFSFNQENPSQAKFEEIVENKSLLKDVPEQINLIEQQNQFSQYFPVHQELKQEVQINLPIFNQYLLVSQDQKDPFPNYEQSHNQNLPTSILHKEVEDEDYLNQSINNQQFPISQEIKQDVLLQEPISNYNQPISLEIKDEFLMPEAIDYQNVPISSKSEIFVNQIIDNYNLPKSEDLKLEVSQNEPLYNQYLPDLNQEVPANQSIFQQLNQEVPTDQQIQNENIQICSETISKVAINQPTFTEYLPISQDTKQEISINESIHNQNLPIFSKKEEEITINQLKYNQYLPEEIKEEVSSNREFRQEIPMYLPEYNPNIPLSQKLKSEGSMNLPYFSQEKVILQTQDNNNLKNNPYLQNEFICTQPVDNQMTKNINITEKQVEEVSSIPDSNFNYLLEDHLNIPQHQQDSNIHQQIIPLNEIEDQPKKEQYLFDCKINISPSEQLESTQKSIIQATQATQEPIQNSRSSRYLPLYQVPTNLLSTIQEEDSPKNSEVKNIPFFQETQLSNNSVQDSSSLNQPAEIKVSSFQPELLIPSLLQDASKNIETPQTLIINHPISQSPQLLDQYQSLPESLDTKQITDIPQYQDDIHLQQIVISPQQNILNIPQKSEVRNSYLTDQFKEVIERMNSNKTEWVDDNNQSNKPQQFEKEEQENNQNCMAKLTQDFNLSFSQNNILPQDVSQKEQSNINLIEQQILSPPFNQIIDFSAIQQVPLQDNSQNNIPIERTITFVLDENKSLEKEKEEEDKEKESLIQNDNCFMKVDNNSFLNPSYQEQELWNLQEQIKEIPEKQEILVVNKEITENSETTISVPIQNLDSPQNESQIKVPYDIYQIQQQEIYPFYYSQVNPIQEQYQQQQEQQQQQQIIEKLPEQKDEDLSYKQYLPLESSSVQKQEENVNDIVFSFNQEANHIQKREEIKQEEQQPTQNIFLVKEQISNQKQLDVSSFQILAPSSISQFELNQNQTQSINYSKQNDEEFQDSFIKNQNNVEYALNQARQIFSKLNQDGQIVASNKEFEQKYEPQQQENIEQVQKVEESLPFRRDFQFTNIDPNPLSYEFQTTFEENAYCLPQENDFKLKEVEQQQQKQQQQQYYQQQQEEQDEHEQEQQYRKIQQYEQEQEQQYQQGQQYEKEQEQQYKQEQQYEQEQQLKASQQQYIEQLNREQINDTFDALISNPFQREQIQVENENNYQDNQQIIKIEAKTVPTESENRHENKFDCSLPEPEIFSYENHEQCNFQQNNIYQQERESPKQMNNHKEQQQIIQYLPEIISQRETTNSNEFIIPSQQLQYQYQQWKQEQEQKQQEQQQQMPQQQYQQQEEQYYQEQYEEQQNDKREEKEEEQKNEQQQEQQVQYQQYHEKYDEQKKYDLKIESQQYDQQMRYQWPQQEKENEQQEEYQQQKGQYEYSQQYDSQKKYDPKKEYQEYEQSMRYVLFQQQQENEQQEQYKNEQLEEQQHEHFKSNKYYQSDEKYSEYEKEKKPIWEEQQQSQDQQSLKQQQYQQYEECEQQEEQKHDSNNNYQQHEQKREFSQYEQSREYQQQQQQQQYQSEQEEQYQYVQQEEQQQEEQQDQQQQYLQQGQQDEQQQQYQQLQQQEQFQQYQQFGIASLPFEEQINKKSDNQEFTAFSSQKDQISYDDQPVINQQNYQEIQERIKMIKQNQESIAQYLKNSISLSQEKTKNKQSEYESSPIIHSQDYQQVCNMTQETQEGKQDDIVYPNIQLEHKIHQENQNLNFQNEQNAAIDNVASARNYYNTNNKDNITILLTDMYSSPMKTISSSIAEGKSTLIEKVFSPKHLQILEEMKQQQKEREETLISKLINDITHQSTILSPSFLPQNQDQIEQSTSNFKAEVRTQDSLKPQQNLESNFTFRNLDYGKNQLSEDKSKTTLSVKEKSKIRQSIELKNKKFSSKKQEGKVNEAEMKAKGQEQNSQVKLFSIEKTKIFPASLSLKMEEILTLPNLQDKPVTYSANQIHENAIKALLDNQQFIYNTPTNVASNDKSNHFDFQQSHEKLYSLQTKENDIKGQDLDLYSFKQGSETQLIPNNSLEQQEPIQESTLNQQQQEIDAATLLGVACYFPITKQGIRSSSVNFSGENNHQENARASSQTPISQHRFNPQINNQKLTEEQNYLSLNIISKDNRQNEIFQDPKQQKQEQYSYRFDHLSNITPFRGSPDSKASFNIPIIIQHANEFSIKQEKKILYTESPYERGSDSASSHLNYDMNEGFNESSKPPPIHKQTRVPIVNEVKQTLTSESDTENKREQKKVPTFLNFEIEKYHSALPQYENNHIPLLSPNFKQIDFFTPSLPGQLEGSLSIPSENNADKNISNLQNGQRLLSIYSLEVDNDNKEVEQKQKISHPSLVSEKSFALPFASPKRNYSPQIKDKKICELKSSPDVVTQNNSLNNQLKSNRDNSLNGSAQNRGNSPLNNSFTSPRLFNQTATKSINNKHQKLQDITSLSVSWIDQQKYTPIKQQYQSARSVNQSSSNYKDKQNQSLNDSFKLQQKTKITVVHSPLPGAVSLVKEINCSLSYSEPLLNDNSISNFSYPSNKSLLESQASVYLQQQINPKVTSPVRKQIVVSRGSVDPSGLTTSHQKYYQRSQPILEDVANEEEIISNNKMGRSEQFQQKSDHSAFKNFVPQKEIDQEEKEKCNIY